MIRLDQTNTQLLSLITAQNGANVVVSYSDKTATLYTGASQVTNITSATTTTICSTPAASTIRDVDHINVKNTYAGSHAVTVQFSSGGTLYPLVTVTLANGDALEWTHGSGWQVLDSNGNKKTASSGLVIASGKTLTVSNSLTLAGTDGTTMTFPSTSATIARTDAANTFTGIQTFSDAISAKAGAVGAPSIYLAADTTTGFYRAGANIIGVTVSGVDRLQVASTGIAVAGGANFTLSQNGDTANTITNSNSGTAAKATSYCVSDTVISQFYAYSSGNTSSLYGITLGGYTEIRSGGSATNGMIIGTGTNNKPIIFGSNAVEVARMTASGISTAYAVLSSGATSGIGYTTGAGGAVTQTGSRTTAVSINKVCGAITLVSAAGSTSPQTFTVNNTAVAATDTIIVNQKSGTDLNIIHVTAVATNSFNITFWTTGGTTTEQPVFNFAVIKAVAA